MHKDLLNPTHTVVFAIVLNFSEHNVICMCTIIYNIARIDFVKLREAATFIVCEISYDSYTVVAHDW